MRAPRLLFCLLAGALLLAGAGARAQPAPREIEEARRLFVSGVQLYRDGLLREALAAFQRAYRLAPRAGSLQNIAQCHRDLRDFPAAHGAYEELLARFGAEMTPEELGKVRRALGDLKLLTGLLEVSSSEPGALLLLGDRELGLTPLPGPTRLNAGVYRVSLRKEGFEPFSREIDLKGGEQLSLVARLVPLAALIAVPLASAPGAPAPSASAPRAPAPAASVPAAPVPVASTPSPGEALDATTEGTRWRGRAGVVLQLERPTHELTSGCPAEPVGGYCDSKLGLGAAADLRLGRSLGWGTVEGVAVLSYGRSSAGASYPAAVPDGEHQGVRRGEEFTLHRVSGFFGVGVRKGVGVFSGGVGAGVDLGAMVLLRDATAADSFASNRTDHASSGALWYAAPAVVLDGGFGLGPGGRFLVGGVALVEALSARVAPADGARSLGISADGRQIPLGAPAFLVASGVGVRGGLLFGVSF